MKMRCAFRMLNVIDEFTHECLTIRVARKLKVIHVIQVLNSCAAS
jgi:putative transposase